MASAKQIQAAKKNIKKAQAAWKNMAKRAHALAQPEGRRRTKPGAGGGGVYFRVVVRPKEEFSIFRYHDVGEKGHLQRLSGKRQSGSWATQAWLIGKEDARVKNGTLVPVTNAAKDLFKKFGSAPRKVKGDVFEAKDRKNIPEREKPTRSQQTARTKNIKKAQEARWR